MPPIISSRTPEGEPNHCPVCHAAVHIEPSRPPGDVPCPGCGMLLWFMATSAGMQFYEAASLGSMRERFEQILRDAEDIGVRSLDFVELIMALEDEFGVAMPPPEEAENFKTIEDAMDYIIRNHLRC